MAAKAYEALASKSKCVGLVDRLRFRRAHVRMSSPASQQVVYCKNKKKGARLSRSHTVTVSNLEDSCAGNVRKLVGPFKEKDAPGRTPK